MTRCLSAKQKNCFTAWSVGLRSRANPRRSILFTVICNRPVYYPPLGHLKTQNCQKTPSIYSVQVVKTSYKEQTDKEKTTLQTYVDNPVTERGIYQRSVDRTPIVRLGTGGRVSETWKVGSRRWKRQVDCRKVIWFRL